MHSGYGTEFRISLESLCIKISLYTRVDLTSPVKVTFSSKVSGKYKFGRQKKYLYGESEYNEVPKMVNLNRATLLHLLHVSNRVFLISKCQRSVEEVSNFDGTG